MLQKTASIGALAFFVSVSSAFACLVCTSQTATCDSTMNSGACECTERTRVIGPNATHRICRVSGVCQSNGSGCDDNEFPVPIQTEPTIEEKLSRAGDIPAHILRELRQREPLAEALLWGLVGTDETQDGLVSGVLLIDDTRKKASASYRFDAEVSPLAGELGLAAVIFDERNSREKMRIDGRLSQGARSGIFTLSDRQGLRSFSWNLEVDSTVSWESGY